MSLFELNTSSSSLNSATMAWLTGGAATFSATVLLQISALVSTGLIFITHCEAFVSACQPLLSFPCGKHKHLEHPEAKHNSDKKKPPLFLFKDKIISESLPFLLPRKPCFSSHPTTTLIFCSNHFDNTSSTPIVPCTDWHFFRSDQPYPLRKTL